MINKMTLETNSKRIKLVLNEGDQRHAVVQCVKFSKILFNTISLATFFKEENATQDFFKIDQTYSLKYQKGHNMSTLPECCYST
jgi:hypothetical protein